MAVIGFQNVALTRLADGPMARAEIWSGGGSALRGPVGRFVEQKNSAGYTLEGVFKRMKAHASRQAERAAAGIQDHIPGARSSVEMSGLRDTVYGLAYTAAVVESLHLLEPAIQSELESVVARALEAFVEFKLKPQAVEIIDASVYSHAVGRSLARIIGLGAIRASKSRVHDETQQEKARKHFRSSFEKYKQRAAGVGGARGFVYTGSHMTRLLKGGKGDDESGVVAFKTQGIVSSGRLWKRYSQSTVFPPDYVGATGQTRDALLGGLYAEGMSIHVGIDESVYKWNKQGRYGGGIVYWELIEMGHGYSWRHPRSKEYYNTGLSEPAKPFMAPLHEWMRTTGIGILDTLILSIITTVMLGVQSELDVLFQRRGSDELEGYGAPERATREDYVPHKIKPKPGYGY